MVTCSPWTGEREVGRDARILMFVERQVVGLSTIIKDAKGIVLAAAIPRLPHCLWSVIDRGGRS